MAWRAIARGFVGVDQQGVRPLRGGFTLRGGSPSIHGKRAKCRAQTSLGISPYSSDQQKADHYQQKVRLPDKTRIFQVMSANCSAQNHIHTQGQPDSRETVPSIELNS